MSTLYYYEPFFSLNDVNRRYEEALRCNTRNTSCSNRDNATAGTNEQIKPFRPRIDLHESAEGNEITAMFELPGMSKDDVIIEVQNNYLTVSGETKFAKDVEEDGYVLKERRRGKFTRTLPLPTDIKAEQIKASIEHGVLTVTFRKSAPEPASKRVAIL